MTQRLRSQVAVTAGLAAATLVVFWPVLRGGFVNLDDPVYVTENNHVLRGLTWGGLWWAFTNLETGNWHPLTWLSHILDYQLFGLRAGWHHLTSLLLHAANTLLLFGVLKRMTGALWRSALVAALFALHPLHVESVAWVAERKDVLSTLFWLLTLWAYVRYVQKAEVTNQKSEARVLSRALRPLTSGRYWPVLLFFTCGLMSKAMVVTLPLVLLLLDYWPLNRVAGCRLQAASSESERSTLGSRPSTILTLVWEKVPLLVLALVTGVMTLHAQRGVGAVASAGQSPVTDRIANATVSYVRYLGQMLWPSDLAVFYPYPRSLSVWAVLGAAMVLLMVTVAALWMGRRRPWLAVGWLWYGVTLLPVIGLIQVGSHARADRYTYVPLIGVFIMVAWGLPWGMGERRIGRTAASAVAAAVLCVCAVLSAMQARHWRDSAALFRHALKVTANNFLAHNGYGLALAEEGQFAAAITEYHAALWIKPDLHEAHSNLGGVLAAQGQLAEAVAECKAALQLRPDYPDAHNNLGNALAAQGRLAEAIAEYRTSLRIRPGYVEAHYNLGNAMFWQGKAAEAVAEYRVALQLRPDYVEARDNLGTALATQGKLAEAVAEYQAVLRLRPGLAQTHYALGNVLAGQGKFGEAVTEYETALRLKPDFAQARKNMADALLRLAWLLATHKDPGVRNGVEAVRLAERLGVITGNQQGEALDVLAAAYAEAGRFDEAVRAAQKATELATAAGQPDLARQIQERLKLYQGGRPYHE